MRRAMNKDFFQWYDENYEFFPLTYDYTFREVFKRNNIFLEKFVSDFLGVEFFGNAKVYFEDDYLKTYEYDVNNYDTFIYITINDCIELVAAVEREFFEEDYFQRKLKEFFAYTSKKECNLDEFTKKIFSKTIVEASTITCGEDYGEPYVYEKTIFLDTTFLSSLDFKDKIRDKRLIWLSALTATSYTELYELLWYVLYEDDLYMFMSYVMDMCNNGFIKYQFEKDTVREMKRLRKKEAEIKQIKLEIAEKMIQENINEDVIKKVLDLTTEDVKNLMKSDTKD